MTSAKIKQTSSFNSAEQFVIKELTCSNNCSYNKSTTSTEQNNSIKLNSNSINKNNSIKINLIGDSIAEGLKINWSKSNSCIESINYYVKSGTTIRYWKNKKFEDVNINIVSLGINDFKNNSFFEKDVSEFEEKLTGKIMWIDTTPSQITPFSVDLHKFYETKQTIKSPEYKTLDGIHLLGKDYKNLSQTIIDVICN